MSKMYDVTYNELLKRMLERVSDKFDKREGSVIFDSHSPTALELELLYVELNRLIAEAYGDTASREFLIRRCKERGITPYKATKAVLKGEFTPTNIDVIGRRFHIGSTTFIVIDKMADGQYQVQCETPGIIGNQQMGSMLPIDYIQGLETAELTEILIPGEDDEETEDLRIRYFDSFDQRAFGGNRSDYLEKTNAIPGVGSTKVTRVWNRDIRPVDMIPNAAVKAWYEEIKPALSGESATWLETVYDAATAKKLTVGGTVLLTILNSEYNVPTDELIQVVQTAIDPEQNAGEGYGIAPIGHIVTVKKAEAIRINVKTNITFDVGYDWNNLQSSINEAIEGYLLELRKTWADNPYLIVRVSQIDTRILSIQGIVDIENTRINDKSDNLTLGKFEVPVFGACKS